MHDPDPRPSDGRPVAAADRRHLALPGTWNVRDVGGYPADGGTTRWGRLLRGDSLHNLQPAGRARLAELGLRTVVDLREPGERRVAPNALDGLTVDVHLQPVADGRIDLSRPWDLAELYPLFVRECGHALAGAVAALTRPDALPALVHCTAGKDRTGLVVALALRAVGVEEDTVVADYVLTSQNYTDAVVEEIRARLRAAGVDVELTQSQFACPPELLRDALALVDADYGGVPAYLEAHGVDAAAQAALRDALVEPD